MGTGASTLPMPEGAKPLSKETLEALSGLPEAAKKELLQNLEQMTPRAQEAPKPNAAIPTEPLASAAAVIEAIHTKKTSCVAAVEAALARIEQTADILAVVDVLKEEALQRAKAVDEKIAAGTALERLEGLPIVVKINIDGPSGSLTTASTPALKDWHPTLNAPIVEKLLAAGAIVIGKTNLPELAIGLQSLSFVHGRTLNPINFEYNAGASSSGTAAAIAAGIVSCGLGTDTAGSLRMPSACCGTVGMRPSSKRPDATSARWPGEGVVGISSMRDVPGPMGSCVGDVALLDAVVACDEVVATKADAGSLKLGVPMDWINQAETIPARKGVGLSPAVQAALALVKEKLTKAGAAVKDVSGMADVLKTSEDTWPVNTPQLSLPVPFEDPHSALQAYLDRHESRPESIKTADQVIEQISEGYKKSHQPHFTGPRAVPEEDRKKKLEATEVGIVKLEEAYRSFFAKNEIQVLMLPTFPSGPTKIEEGPGMGMKVLFNEVLFLFHMNEIHVPSIVLPIPGCKYEDSNVPCSLLLYGLDDKQLLSVALAVEDAIKA